MPNFKYEAQDAFGDVVRGVVAAGTETDARGVLHAQGLLVKLILPTTDLPQAAVKAGGGKPFLLEPTGTATPSASAAYGAASAAASAHAMSPASWSAAAASAAAGAVAGSGTGGPGLPPSNGPGTGALGVTADPTAVLYLLEQIRDAILALSGGYSRATGQAGRPDQAAADSKGNAHDFLVHTGSAEDYLAVMSQKSAGEDQSGANLAGYIRGIVGMLRRRSKGYGGQRAGTEVGALGIHFGESGEFGGDVGLGGEGTDGKKPNQLKRFWRSAKSLVTTPKQGATPSTTPRQRHTGATGGPAPSTAPSPRPTRTPGQKKKSRKRTYTLRARLGRFLFGDSVPTSGNAVYGRNSGGASGQSATTASAAATHEAGNAVSEAGFNAVGKFKAVGTGAAKLGAALFEAGKVTYNFARQAEKEVRRLAEVGGEQAAGIAVLDAERIRRDIKTARETGESARKLTQAINKFEEEKQPIDAVVTNAQNWLGTAGMNMLSGTIRWGKSVVETIRDVANQGKIDSDQAKKEKEKDREMFPYDRLEKLAEETRRLNKQAWPTGPAQNPNGFVGPGGR